MKKTQRIEAIRNIRRNRVSFLSIVIISMLAVTAYLGLSFSAEGLLRSADATCEAGCAAGIEISAAALMTEEDVSAVLGMEGVEDAEGILALPSRVINESVTEDVEIRSLPKRISLPRLLEGRLPETENECAVEKTLAGKMNYRVGSEVRLSGRSALTDAAVSVRAYTVTGIFTTPAHLTEMSPFEPVVLVTRGAFNTQLLPENRYSCLLVRFTPDNPYRFSGAWKKSADRVCGRLEAINGSWFITPFHNTANYICVEEGAGMLNTVSVYFSMLFVVIAALVIYSTISRLIGFESHLVGAAKAMGLTNNEIFAKYLLFGAGGAVIGALAGILIAFFIFERIILFFYGTVYMLSRQVMAFLPVPVLIVLAGAVLLGFVSVFLACRRLMKSTAVSLMKGDDAGRRRRKKTGSGKGALYTRLILRNMRTDWKRVMISIVSVAGSCMLLFIGFSLKFAISRVPERQYDRLRHFSMKLVVDPSVNPGAMDSVRSILEEEQLPCAAVCAKNVPYKAGNEIGMLSLTCPDDGQSLSDYYSFTGLSGAAIPVIPESGLLVSRMISVKYGLEPGDCLSLYDSRSDLHEAKIAGVFENYIGINVFCSKSFAEESLGETPTANTLLLLREPDNPDALRQKLSGVKGFISLSSAREQEALFNGISAMLNLIILMMGVLAAMIACFILLNLVSTYVNQKKNELTIMRINGYTVRETIHYASMECYWITAAGILLGLAGGLGFSLFLIGKINMVALSFISTPVWISFAASAAITAVISGVIHFIAFRKIRGLKLSDIQR